MRTVSVDHFGNSFVRYGMIYDELLSLVRRGLSIREISSETSSSYTNIRYWLRKHRLKTLEKPRSKFQCRCGETDRKKFYGHKRHMCGKCQSEYVTRKGKETKEKIVAVLGGGCAHCGYNGCVDALDIHHKDPGRKDPNFRSIRGWSWSRIEKELKNCTILCKNHHAEFHAGILIFRNGMYVNG